MLKVIVVDDVLPSLENLADLLEEFKEVDIVGKFQNPLEALKKIVPLEVDVVFVDIEMPGIDGINFAIEALDIKSDIDIVFVTAYSEYAVEAFVINALDYIVKPAIKERLQKTIERLLPSKTSLKKGSLIDIKCFGNFKVIVDNKNLIKWRTKKTEELFALFISNSPKELSRSKILEYLWPEFNEEKAITHFNTNLYNLKKAFAIYGIDNLIVNNGGNYSINAKNMKCDLWDFEKKYSSKFEVDSSNYEQTINSLTNEYSQILFQDDDYIWLIYKQNLLDEIYEEIILKLIRFLKSINESKRAVQLLYKAIERDSINEELYKELIETYISENKKSLALKVFDLYKKKLKVMLGEKPDKEIEKLLK